MEKINTFELMSFIYALCGALDDYSKEHYIVRDDRKAFDISEFIEYMTEGKCCDALINEEFNQLSSDAVELMIDLFDSLKFTGIEKIEEAYKKALDLYFKEAAEV